MHAPEWPDALLSTDDVLRWIDDRFPRRTPATGPHAIYRSKAWGVTARFALSPEDESPASVVFKASYLPSFAQAPRISSLLAHHCPTVTPQPLAWTWRDDGTWMLFAPFAGEPITAQRGGESGPAQAPPAEALIAVARTFGQIQRAIAGVPPEQIAGLPRFAVSQIPGVFDDLATLIAEHHLTAWQADDGAIIRRVGLPNRPLASLARWRMQVARWAGELAALPWPDTIDHVDLHTGNATLRSDGGVLIYDWEEALIGNPFFSLDRLLADARRLDYPRDSAPEADAIAALASVTERIVRDAYIDALPWGDRAARERALDLALLLAPLKAAHEAEAFADALGWDDGHPRLTAWHLARALRRWEAVATPSAP
ncbi:MAG: phosphotransferase [Thermomicrobiales bacterium]